MFTIYLIDELDQTRETHSCPDIDQTLYMVEQILRCGLPNGWRVSIK